MSNCHRLLSALLLSIAASVISAAESDFNADGNPDILWRDYFTGENSVWMMAGVTPSDFKLIQSVTDLGWEMIGAGDFNGDNNPDIVWRNQTTGQNSIWLMNGTNASEFRVITEVADLNWKMAGVGDFNDDHKPDLLWRNEVTGDNSIWLMNGTQPTDFIVVTKVADLGWHMSGSGDFDGDGRSDILWRNYKTGENSIWLMNGTQPKQFVTIQAVPDLNWQMAGGGDFNHDGNSDILWRNYSTGENSIWIMDGVRPTSFLTIQGQSDVRWQIAGTRSAGHDLITKGRIQCQAPNYNRTDADHTPTTTNIAPWLGVRVGSSAIVNADEAGEFRGAAPSQSTPYGLRFYYNGSVPTNLATGGTPLQVMDDGHNTRSDTRTLTPVGRNAFSIDFGTVTLNTVDCEAWRIGARVLADYHQVMKRSPPAGRLRIKRWENVVVGTPLTFYDYITIPTDFMTDTEYPSAQRRVNGIFHEFGHSVRHVADGSHEHWNDDNVAYIYAQDHNSGTTIHNKPFSFNEGWADYWVRARAEAHTPLAVDAGCVLPTTRDWNEGRVANTLLTLHEDIKAAPRIKFFLDNLDPKPNPDEFVDAWMLSILIDNPGEVHTLEKYLALASQKLQGFVPPNVAMGGVPGCPTDFHDDGLFCRRDAKSIVKPSGGCPCGFHDHGPTCFRNTLIFRDF